MVVKFWGTKRPVWFQKNDDSKLGKKKMDELYEELDRKGYNVYGASDDELLKMKSHDEKLKKEAKRK